MSDLHDNLAKLWTKRAGEFEEAAEKSGNELQDNFCNTAIAYRLCAKELLNPPTEIFERQEPQEKKYDVTLDFGLIKR